MGRVPPPNPNPTQSYLPAPNPNPTLSYYTSSPPYPHFTPTIPHFYILNLNLNILEVKRQIDNPSHYPTLVGYVRLGKDERYSGVVLGKDHFSKDVSLCYYEMSLQLY